MNEGRESSPVGDAVAGPRASRRSTRFVRLGAALVTCAALVSGLFLGASFLMAPARSTPSLSFQPSPSSVNTDAAVPSPTPDPQASATATPAFAGTTIQDVLRFDAKAGLIFLSDATGDYLRTTKDGGTTWSELRSMPSAGPKFAADFIDIDHGWRAYGLTAPAQDKGPASLKVARTTDGGKTWHDATAFSSGIETQAAKYNNVTIHFRDRSNGVLLITFSSGLVGGDGVQNWPPFFCGELTTSDGGATWSAPKSGRCLVRHTFVSDLLGYAEIMDEGWGYTYDPPAALAVTMDGGQTWTDAQFPTGWTTEDWTTKILFMQRRSDGTLRALCACGLKFGGSNFMNPSVISSKDGGKTWTSVGKSLGFGSGAFWVGAASEDRWLSKATPMNTLEVSDDGGLTWQQLAPAGLPEGKLPGDLAIWSNGWMVTSTVPCNVPGYRDECPVTPTQLYVTDDGGKTLRPIAVP